MGANSCKALEQDLNRISYKLSSAAPGEASYITVCVRPHQNPDAMPGQSHAVLNGKSKVKVELNEKDTVSNIKKQLMLQGVTSKEYNITSLNHSSGLLLPHLTLSEQGVVSDGKSDITLHAARKLQCMQLLQGHTSSLFFVASLSDGRVMSASEDGTVRYWTESGAAKQVIRGLLTGVGCMALLQPNGKALVTGSVDDNVARIWEAQRQWKCTHMLKGHAGAILSVAALHQGHTVATGSSDSTVRTWNAATGACMRVLTAHEAGVLCMQGVDTTDKLLTGSRDCTVRVWDTPKETCSHVLEGHSEPVSCLLVMEEGRIASGSMDQTVRIWGEDFECLCVLEGHTGGITCVIQIGFSGCLMTGSLDYTARLWGMDGDCVQVLTGHSGAVQCVAELPNKRVATGSYDYSCRVWEESTGQSSQQSMDLKSTWFTNADEELVEV